MKRHTTFLSIIVAIAALMANFALVAAQQDPPPGTPPPRPGDGTRPPRPEDGGERPPRPDDGDSAAEELDASVTQVMLDIASFETFGAALAAQVAAGDGAGIDSTFRNSGVVLDEAQNAYYAVNGVHPVNPGDYSSYYPKSIVLASMEDDTVIRAYSFSEVNGHDVDMEALAFAEDPGLLYIGDEYNYIYEMDLASGTVLREWDLADIGVSTGTDRGIEAMTYSPETGYFYAGIQDTGEVMVVDLGLATGDTTVTLVDQFQVARGWSPSGLFAHPNGSLYVVSMMGGGQAGNQMIFQYGLDGTLNCAISIPADLGMTRPDGVAFDSANENIYIVDSQGPIYGGYSLYKVAWSDPCAG